MSEEQNYWRKCSVCKKEIPFNSTYYACSVSTCRKQVFCTDTCWDIHAPTMNHKSAWAEQEKAPSKDQEERKPRRIIVQSAGNSTDQATLGSFDRDILIVASKLKKYLKDRHDLNTSSNVMDRLSDLVRNLCDNAVENARAESRKTLMDRDFK